MSYWSAHDMKRDYLCAACWGELNYRQEDKENPQIVNVYCIECKNTGPGFISRKFVEWYIWNNDHQYQLALDALRDALPWLHPDEKRTGLTVTELLKSFGARIKKAEGE
jgi:hypothetical protein